MCCLGFACLQLSDLTPNDILVVGEPRGVRTEEEIPHLTTRNEDDDLVNTDFSSEAIPINDDMLIDDHERMARLRALARKHGLAFRFTHQNEKKLGR